MARDITIATPFVRQALAGAERAGLDTNQMLAQCGISPRMMSLPLGRIPLDPYVRLLQALFRTLNDECLGLLPRPQPIGTYEILTRAVLHEPDLGSAMTVHARTSRLLNPQMICNFERAGDHAIYRVGLAAGVTPLSNHLYEIVAINTHRFLCWMCRTRVRLEWVELPYGPQPWAEEYRNLFLGAPVRFDQDSTALIFRSTDLGMPTQQNATALTRYIRRAPRDLFTPFRSSAISDQARRLVLAQLEQGQRIPSAEQAARTLGFKPQTFWRRLRDEGTDYTEVRTQARRDRAIWLLTQHDTSVEQIAESLDFSESSAFVRAFRRWTGMTPLVYRRCTGSGQDLPARDAGPPESG